MDAEVGPVDGTQRPWCRERTVRVGAADERGEEEAAEAGVRRGCNARNATNGYVVACNFSAATSLVCQ